MSEQFSTPEQALIERLRRAPQPELPAEARAMIRARVLDALDHPPAPTPRPALLRPMAVIAVVMVTAALIIGGILFVLSRQTEQEITPMPSSTLTVLPPTFTPTATAQAILTLIPTASATESLGIITVIEGPVEQVDGNVITIYGTPVQIPTNDPILTTVSVGDVVRIEGNNQSGTSQVTIINTPVINVTAAVNTNPSSGEVWEDDGTCSHPPPDWSQLTDGEDAVREKTTTKVTAASRTKMIISA